MGRVWSVIRTPSKNAALQDRQIYAGFLNRDDAIYGAGRLWRGNPDCLYYVEEHEFREGEEAMYSTQLVTSFWFEPTEEDRLELVNARLSWALRSAPAT